jgi:hypothetical protein
MTSLTTTDLWENTKENWTDILIQKISLQLKISNFVSIQNYWD